MKKERLDVLLVKKGLASSREKAKAIIMSGIVFVDGQREDKAGSTFDEKQEIIVKGKTLKYVSRGGLKLEKAMKNFDIVFKRQSLHGCWSIYRWIYRLYVAKWCSESIFS